MSVASHGGFRQFLRTSRVRHWVLRTLGWIDGPGRPARSPRAALAQAPLDVLKAKIVFSHARNRQQMLGPPPTALGQFDDARTELLIQAAILAARASGAFDDAAQRRLRGVLSSVGLQSGNAGFLQRALDQPASLDQVLHHARDAHVVSLVYSASLLGVDRHDEAGQTWLRYLAARMRIPADTLARLHSQFGVPG